MKIFLLFIVVYLYHIEASTNFILKVNDTGCAIRARSTPTSGVIKFISKDEKLKTVKSLFVKSEGKYQFLSLPKPSNGSIQLLLRPNHPIMKAAENINTEFYLK